MIGKVLKAIGIAASSVAETLFEQLVAHAGSSNVEKLFKELIGKNASETMDNVTAATQALISKRIMREALKHGQG